MGNVPKNASEFRGGGSVSSKNAREESTRTHHQRNQASVNFDDDIFSFGKKVNIPSLDLNPALEKWLRLYLEEAVKLQSKVCARIGPSK